MIIILSLIIIFLVINHQSTEKGQLSMEDWKEGIQIIGILGGVLGFGLLVVYLMETYYFNS